MKSILLVLTVACLGFASCSKEPEQMTKEEFYQKVDSITRVRIQEADDMAQRDLQHRMKIEVKVKADSIVNSRQAARADSLLQMKKKAGVK